MKNLKRIEINKEIFFIEYKKKFGKIKNQKTINTINAMIAYVEKHNVKLEHFAYVLSTAKHEAQDAKSVSDFYPIKERGSVVYITSRYWFNKRIRRSLGNKYLSDAWRFKGAGLVQLTGRSNYERFNTTPEKMLTMDESVRVIFDGMIRGEFTGVGLNRYINNDKVDYFNARRTVNRMDKARKIECDAVLFEIILNKSAYFI